MYANNFMAKDTSFHPEIIALNENLTFSEFILKDPVFREYTKKAYYISDYPLVCYLA